MDDIWSDSSINVEFFHTKKKKNPGLLGLIENRKFNVSILIISVIDFRWHIYSVIRVRQPNVRIRKNIEITLFFRLILKD